MIRLVGFFLFFKEFVFIAFYKSLGFKQIGN